MNRPELEALLEELDEALAKAFPGPEPMCVLVVGGACLLFQGVVARPTEDVDVIIFDMMGSEESTLIFHSPTADKIRRIIKGIGKRHGLRGERQMFFNDDCSPFLLELGKNELPAMRLLKAYRKLHLYIKPQQLTAKALLTDFLETLSSSETLLAWRVGFILGEMIGLLHPDLDTQDASLSYLEALEQHCQRRTC